MSSAAARARLAFAVRRDYGPRLAERRGLLLAYDVVTAGQPRRDSSRGLIVGALAGAGFLLWKAKAVIE